MNNKLITGLFKGIKKQKRMKNLITDEIYASEAKKQRTRKDFK